MDAEAPRRIAQALPHEPAQRGHLRDTVALDHVAKEHGVHVALQELDAQRRRESLRFGEPALDQVLAEALLDQRPLRGGPAFGLLRRLLAAMAQELAEAEGPDDGRHPATAQRGVDLAREHPRRGAGDDDLDLLGVEHAAHEALPARHELDLVEEPVHGLAPAQRG